MAVSPTTPPTITDLPPAPSTSNPSTFNTLANNFVAAQVTMQPEVNAANDWVEKTAGEVYDNAVEAKASADNALSAASDTNFYGNWSSLTGALNKPATVFHNDLFWLLNVNLADVTASEPTLVNTDWRPKMQETILLASGTQTIVDAAGLPDKYQITFVRPKAVLDAVVQTTTGNFKTSKGDFNEIIVGDMYGFTATCINGIWEV